ncbi:MAG: DNA polymerase III subunit gamma/tau [Patescibacteria group bacterium]
MSLALYRKYRPKNFDDLIGQSYLVDVFRNAAKKKKLAHAYIFYGPRGTGKTTTARLVAKIANCSSEDSLRKLGEPCNRCSVCREIDNGQAMDVIEIDAASNRGIDEIRDLKNSIRLFPNSCRYKVFIIDEAHMLTKEAFNALLKTLEEPPEHAILILATTEYEKIPATISSRAQRFHFNKLSLADIIGKLKIIIAKEKFKITNDATELIASAAEGSLRDAESLLDQVVSLSGEADLKVVENIIGKVGFKRIADLTDLIMNRNLSGSLQFLHQLNDSGANLTEFNKELINYLRRVLALSCDKNMEAVFQKDLIKDEIGKIKIHSQKISKEKLVSLLRSLIRAYSDMRYSPFPHIPIELALIENL